VRVEHYFSISPCQFEIKLPDGLLIDDLHTVPIPLAQIDYIQDRNK
jgi:hypothetical protein